VLLEHLNPAAWRGFKRSAGNQLIAV